MDDVLREYKNKFCMAYLDDVIVYSRTFEEHMKHLELIFKKFVKSNI